MNLFLPALSLLPFFFTGCTMTPDISKPKPADPTFHLVSVKKVEGSRQGTFTFTNTTRKPIEVYAFDTPEDGECQLRFTIYLRKTEKGWENAQIGYCGTGLEVFPLQPGRTYRLREYLFPYDDGAEVGQIQMATVGKRKYWSQPFDLRAFR